MASDPFQFLDDQTTVALDELLAVSGLAPEELVELIDFGALEPVVAGEPRRFASRAIVQVRRAARLRDDFGLNPPGMALALVYIERIDELERRLRELECQMLR
jgi:chaperone modulatory protein CbpM